MRGRDFQQIPDNEQGLRAGVVLRPSESSLTVFGTSSLDFVKAQGGDEDTFIFLLGISKANLPIKIIEGVFLNKDGPGFRPTWGVAQLIREIGAGGWEVIPVAEVLESWVERIEQRMNLKSGS